jgi:hypothetical protein
MIGVYKKVSEDLKIFVISALLVDMYMLEGDCYICCSNSYFICSLMWILYVITCIAP